MMSLTLEQKNAATEDLNKKLRLENIMGRELRPLMIQMNKDFRTFYASSGRIISFDIYTPDMIAVLRRSYKRAQKLFTGVIVEQNHLTGLETKQSELLDAGLLAWIADKLRIQPQGIISTTQADANLAVNQAQQALIDAGEPITSTTVAIAAAVINRRKLFGRIPTITMTETQAAAEATKLMEAEVLSGRIPFSLRDNPFAATIPRETPLKEGTKQWITVGDGKVRASHMSANRQTITMDAAFNVGGSRLRHPGDSSLGAPVREVINCRCSSNIQIEGF